MAEPAPSPSPSHIHLPDLHEDAGEFALEGAEAHYLVRVVRVRTGDVVTASDGRGATAELEVVAVRPGLRVAVRNFTRHTVRRRLEIWCGAPEGDRADWLIEKLGELGAAKFQPLETERVRWQHAARRHERWERLAIAALRQSRARQRLEIGTPAGLAECLKSLAGAEHRWLADPDGPPAAARPGPVEGTTVIAVGSSSGFSSAELKSLQADGFAPLRLAECRLRAETAALAAACWWAGGA